MYVFSQGQARTSQSRTDESFLIVFRERTVTAFCFCLSQTFCWRWNTPWKFCSDDAPLVCVPFSQGVCMANKWISTTNPRFKCMITNHLHQITCLAEKRNKYRKGKLQLQEESHNKFAQLRFNALISVFFSSAVLFIFFWKGSWKERWQKAVRLEYLGAVERGKTKVTTTTNDNTTPKRTKRNLPWVPLRHNSFAVQESEESKT